MNQAETQPDDDARTRSGSPGGRIVAAIMAFVLMGVGLLVFILPFAFPIHPPVIQGIRSTVSFSPVAQSGRNQAVISFKMNEAGTASVTIADPADRGGTIRKVLRQGSAPAGRLGLTWDGRGDDGTIVPDGRYVIAIKGRAGSRSWNSNRPIYVDTTAPKASTITVRSAISFGARGACEVAVTAAEAATVRIDVARPPGTGTAVATRAAAPIGKSATARWTWDGTDHGKRVQPGLYVVVVTLSDRLRNSAQSLRTCWVANGGGSVVPARPRSGDAIRIRLSDQNGRALPPTTPVIVWLARRNGAIGGTNLDPVGARVGKVVRRQLGRTELLLPRRVALADLWVVAKTDRLRVVIPLRP